LSNNYFQFKRFCVHHDRCAMKVGTDGVLLGATAAGGRHILDIGTGTGLVALMMAQRFPEAHIVGIDINGDACQQARENVLASPFRNVQIVHASLQEFNPAGKPQGTLKAEKQPQGTMLAAPLFDAIVCNPPFFEESLQCPDEARNAARHAGSLPYSVLLQNAAQLLTDEGTLTLIIPTDYVPRVEGEGAYAHLFIHRLVHIRTVERKAPKRTLVALGKHPQPREVVTHVLMQGGERSPWYAEITKEFYL
jgi:tRNA1Val (adenine37-N6)-methyltransferase